MGTLIDSSVFIAAERGDLPLRAALALLDPFQDCFISAVTVFELLHGIHRADTPAGRATREAHAERFIQAIPVIPFDEGAARVPPPAARSPLRRPGAPPDTSSPSPPSLPRRSSSPSGNSAPWASGTEIVFVAAFPAARTLARLRIAGHVTATVARLATGRGGSPLGRAGFAPAGQHTEFHGRIAFPLLSDQILVVALNYLCSGDALGTTF